MCWELSSILIDERVWKWFLNDTVETGTVALVLTTVVSIHIGYSRTEMKTAINAQNKNWTRKISPKQWWVMYLYYSEKYTLWCEWDKLVYLYSGFVDESYTLPSLFDDVEQIEKDNRTSDSYWCCQRTVWFLAIQKEPSQLKVPEILTVNHRGHSAGGLEGLKMNKKNTVQFPEIRSKGCNDIEMLEKILHGIVETATSKLRQRKLKTTEISIRLVHAKSENRLPLEFTF